jgi:hypothetical protein
MPVFALRWKNFNGVEPTFMQNRQHKNKNKVLIKANINQERNDCEFSKKVNRDGNTKF